MPADDQRSVLSMLADESRILRRARMLPETGPLSSQQSDAVAAQFRDFLRRHDLSQQDVARALGKGYSAATVSKWANAANRGEMDHVTRAINQFMEDRERQAEAAPPPGFVETAVAEAMLQVIRLAKTQRGLGVIMGPAGVGKTMTARAAQQLMTGSIYIRVNQQRKRARGLLLAMAEQIGVSARMDSAKLAVEIAKMLYGTGRVMLIDEAHQLRPESLEQIRDLHDECGDLPIVLIGTTSLGDMVDDRTMNLGQFGSRIAARINVAEYAQGLPGGGRRGKREAGRLYSIDEIRTIFERGKIRLADDAAEMLAELAAVMGLGSLRLCGKIVATAAQTKAGSSGKPITASLLRRVLEQLHGRAFRETASVRMQAQPSAANRVRSA